MNRISSDGIALIQEFEGLRLKAYRCSADVWTVGWGHTTAAGPPRVSEGMTITAQQADDILRDDLRKYEAGVRNAVKVQLTQNQFDALVSFAYNCGIGALQKSTLLKRVNAGRFDDVPAEFMKWTRAGGKQLPGLVRRRRAEAALWRSIDEAEPVKAEESRAAPDVPKPPKSIARSKEANAAIAAGGAGAIAAASEVAPIIRENAGVLTILSDALGKPVLIAMVVVVIAAGVIWYFRRKRLKEEGA